MRDQAEPFLLEQIKKLEEENKALREDAERYRWLRNNENFRPMKLIGRGGRIFYLGFDGQHFDTLDAAIDVLRRKS